MVSGAADAGAAPEAVDDAVGHYALGCGVCDAYPGKEDGEEIAHKRTGVAQEALDAVGGGLLLFVHEVSNHHLEGLHCHVDGCVKEDEGEETEPHCGVQAKEQIGGGEVEASGLGKQEHHQHGHNSSHKQIRLAPAHAGPGAVRPFADERLDYHAHERRQNPEKTQLVRIGAKGGEDTADIGALQRVGNLNPEKAEAQVEHLGEGQVAFVGHFLFKAYVAAYKYKNFYQLYILIRHK